jgi:phospholipid/cholesterol/gamma-HCH transport system permease protein
MTLPHTLQKFLDETGDISRFVVRFFSEGFKPRYEFGELVRQSFFIGYKSLPLVSITAFIMGLVLTIQLDTSVRCALLQ